MDEYNSRARNPAHTFTSHGKRTHFQRVHKKGMIEVVGTERNSRVKTPIHEKKGFYEDHDDGESGVLSMLYSNIAHVH